MVITDAQVTAAVEAYLAHEGWATDEIGKAKVAGRMRAALEAATALEPRKVYVTVDSYPYEGYGAPGGAYSTREAAQADLDRNRAYLNDPEVFELKLDE